MSAASAHTVAAELRARVPGLTPLRLHKLLYYCQGHHLASFGKPLFDERVSAWDKGPVVGSLWHDEKVDGPVTRDPQGLDESALNTIGYVLSRYGALSARDLVNLTHSELPWQRADSSRGPGESVPIAPEWMREYFGDEPPDEDDLTLDPGEVSGWLNDAQTRLDRPARRDDPDEIAATIATLSARKSDREPR